MINRKVIVKKPISRLERKYSIKVLVLHSVDCDLICDIADGFPLRTFRSDHEDKASLYVAQKPKQRNMKAYFNLIKNKTHMKIIKIILFQNNLFTNMLIFLFFSILKLLFPFQKV